MSALLYKFPFEPCVISSIFGNVLEVVIISSSFRNTILFVLTFRHCLEIIIMAVYLVNIVVLVIALSIGSLLNESLLLVLGNIGGHKGVLLAEGLVLADDHGDLRNPVLGSQLK